MTVVDTVIGGLPRTEGKTADFRAGYAECARDVLAWLSDSDMYWRWYGDQRWEAHPVSEDGRRTVANYLRWRILHQLPESESVRREVIK